MSRTYRNRNGGRNNAYFFNNRLHSKYEHASHRNKNRFSDELSFERFDARYKTKPKGYQVVRPYVKRITRRFELPNVRLKRRSLSGPRYTYPGFIQNKHGTHEEFLKQYLNEYYYDGFDHCFYRYLNYIEKYLKRPKYLYHRYNTSLIY